MKEYYFNEINSTQEFAKKIINDGIESFVVYADYQTSGRGRFGRKWESPIGGLWFSFDMDILDKNGFITLIVGVTTLKVLKKYYNCDLQVKWPNDLILNNKKAGGIICEKINDKVVVGIGINTNITSAPEEKAITFFEACDQRVNNHEIMLEIIDECKKNMKLKNIDIINEFRKNMAYQGEMCFISSLNKKAKVLDVADNGNLIVEVDNEKKEILAGEINKCI